MANAVEKLNTIAIADIEKVNTITDADLEDLNTLEFTGVLLDAHTLISTHTASSSATVDITSGINSTYDVYQFVFTDIHPSGDNVNITFQVNAVGGSGFNETFTSTFAAAHHKEDDTNQSSPYYETGFDQAQGTAYNIISTYSGNAGDESASGMLTLYAPSSTTYVKHWFSRIHLVTNNEYSRDNYAAGYINTTAAIDEISFKMNSGDIDSGVIKMYGLAKS